MPSVSSLLRSAQSRQAKIQEQQDALVAYEYANSAKTYEDFVQYSKYLNDRISKVSDPSKALTYTKAIDSARSGYISNEIQRSSIDIIEGRGTSTEKYQKMVGLFYQAVDAGQYDLAQSLHLQLDNLSVTIQNEQQSAQRAAATMALNGYKSLNDFNNAIKNGTEKINLPDGSYIKPIPMLEEELKQNGKTQFGFFAELQATIDTLRQTAIDAYYAAPTQDAVDKIQAKYEDLLTGQQKFSVGGLSLTGKEIELAAKSAEANNPLYSPVASQDETTGQRQFKLVKNKIDNFVWIRNDDGTYSAIQERAKVISPYQGLDTRITNDGYIIDKSSGNIGNGNVVKGKNNSDALSIKNRLAAYGITATPDSNGALQLTLQDGTQVQGTIQPDGSIRYFGAPGQYSGGNAGMYQINVLDGQVREVAPGETSDFGIQSQFGGNLSQTSDIGKNYINKYLGNDRSSMTQIDINKAIVGIDQNFTGNTSAVTTSLLQGASLTRGKLEAEAAARAAALASTANIAQSATNFALNTTPVRNFAENGQPVRQLAVAPVRTPTVTKVSVAQPTRNITNTTTKSTGLGLGTVSGSSLQGGSGGIRL